MKKRVFTFVFLIFFGMLILKASTTLIPQAKEGVIELSSHNLQDNYIQLDGEWEFFWDTLLTPEGIAALPAEIENKYILVPKAWSSKKAGSFPVKGTATYRLKINSTDLEGTYGIRLHDLFTASKVWFDGNLIYTTGKTGYNKKDSRPDFAYEEIPLFFDIDYPEHELVIQVSNFHHTRSGLVKPIKFGLFDNLAKQSKGWLILNLIIIGIILVISFNHLINYFLHKNEITNLYFGLLCLVMIMRNISTGQRVIAHIFPDINWHLLFKMDNFSGFGTIPLFAIFMYISFRQDFSKFFFRFITGLGLLISIFVIFTPQLLYGRFRMGYELYVLCGGLYITFAVLLPATLRKREGALLTFIGFFILYATAINDVLISMGVLTGFEVAPFGLVIYMLVQSYVLTFGSAKAVIENKKLSEALKNEKEMLAENVKERTRELELRNDEIIKNQEELKSESWLNESLAGINTILNQYNKSDIRTLSQHLISEIVKLMDAQIGVIYVINQDESNPLLELTGSKNAGDAILSNSSIAPGEGQLGACFQDMHMKVLENINESYVKYYSGLGETHLKNLVLIPLHSSKIPVGVIEIASHKKLTDTQFKLVEKITRNISSTLQFIRSNNRNMELISEYKEKETLFEDSQSEFIEQSEELQALREQLASLKQMN